MYLSQCSTALKHRMVRPIQNQQPLCWDPSQRGCYQVLGLCELFLWFGACSWWPQLIVSWGSGHHLHQYHWYTGRYRRAFRMKRTRKWYTGYLFRLLGQVKWGIHLYRYWLTYWDLDDAAHRPWCSLSSFDLYIYDWKSTWWRQT